MSSAVLLGGDGMVRLQSALASSSYGTPGGDMLHHPITCLDRLEYDEAGFRCPHVSVPTTEERTVAAVQHSIALLILELAEATL